MPQFKIRDLMINLGSTEVELKPNFCWLHNSCWQFNSCWHFQSCWQLNSCWQIFSCHHAFSKFETIVDNCAIPSRLVTPVSPRCPDPTPTILIDPTVIDTQDLTVLKQQLQAQLAAVEAREQAAAEALRPKTIDEVNQLEEQLQGALEELRAMKQRMGGD